MAKGTLQFKRYKGIFENRNDALSYINGKDASKYGAPVAVKYKDDNGSIQVIFGIGNGEESAAFKYQVIDSARIDEDLKSLSGAADQLRKDLEAEIERAKSEEARIEGRLDDEINRATAEEQRIESKLDEEIAARKAVDGQSGQTYVPNKTVHDESTGVHRDIFFIDEAKDLNDADVILDNALNTLCGKTIHNVIVNSGITSADDAYPIEIAEGKIEDQVVKLDVSTTNLYLPGNYKEIQQDPNRKPHPLHPRQQLSDAIATLEANYNEEVSKIDGIHIGYVETGLPANVRIQYHLLDRDGNSKGFINVFKDSRVTNLVLGHFGDTFNSADGSFADDGTGATRIALVYLDTEGKYQHYDASLDVFNNEIQAVVDSKIAEIQQELDNSQIGAGLGNKGEYKAHYDSNYLSGATSLDSADLELDSALKKEELNRVNADADLSEKITDEANRATASENALSDRIGDLELFSEKAQSEIDSIELGAGLNDDGTYTASLDTHYLTNTEVNSLRKADETLDQNLYRVEVGLDNERARAIEAEGNLQQEIEKHSIAAANSAKTLNTYITEVDERLQVVEPRNVVGSQAVKVTGSDNQTKTISLAINENDKVLAQGDEGLRAHIELRYDKSVIAETDSGTTTKNMIYLVGKDDTIISEIDANEFIQDGIIETVEFDQETKVLKIIFKTASGDKSVDISLANLIDTYTVPEELQAYLTISGYTITPHVDTETGLASYPKLKELSGATSTLSGSTQLLIEHLYSTDWAQDYSIRHIMDNALLGELVKDITPSDAKDQSLIRKISGQESQRFYVSNNARDMSYSGTSLEQTITKLISDLDAEESKSDGIQDNLTQLSGSVMNNQVLLNNLSSSTVNHISSAETKFEAIDSQIQDINDHDSKQDDRIDTLSGTVNNVQAELDKTQASIGLQADGSYKPHNIEGDTAHYISGVTSMDAADMKLDSSLFALSGKTIEVETNLATVTSDLKTLSGSSVEIETNLSALTEKVSNLESSSTESISDLEDRVTILQSSANTLMSGLTEAQSAISGLTARVETLETGYTELRTEFDDFKNSIEQKIRETVFAYLNGTANEIKLTQSVDNNKLTIGFADDAIFGPIQLGGE